MTRLQRQVLLLASLVLTTVACRSLGTSDDRSEVDRLMDEIQDYQSWAQFEGHPGIQKSRSKRHGKFVATYINEVAAQDPAGLPFGSILVKANYSEEDRDALTGITVMKRIEGYDEENADWFWARYDADWDPTHAGKVSMCSDCHFDGGNDDFVFLND